MTNDNTLSLTDSTNELAWQTYVDLCDVATLVSDARRIRDEWIIKLCDRGENLEEIKANTGVSTSHVLTVLKKADRELPKKRGKTMSEEDVEFIIEARTRKKKLPVGKIFLHFNGEHSMGAIRKVMAENGLVKKRQ